MKAGHLKGKSGGQERHAPTGYKALAENIPKCQYLSRYRRPLAAAWPMLTSFTSLAAAETPPPHTMLALRRWARAPPPRKLLSSIPEPKPRGVSGTGAWRPPVTKSRCEPLSPHPPGCACHNQGREQGHVRVLLCCKQDSSRSMHVSPRAAHADTLSTVPHLADRALCASTGAGLGQGVGSWRAALQHAGGKEKVEGHSKDGARKRPHSAYKGGQQVGVDVALQPAGGRRFVQSAAAGAYHAGCLEATV